MEPADIDQVLSIEQRSFTLPWSRRFFERELVLQFSRTLVASCRDDPEQNVAGYVVTWIVSDEMHLLNIAVSPEHRRNGVGRLLLERVIEEAAGYECSYVVLEVRVSSIGAQELYRQMGFEVISRRPRYYSDNNEDAFVMMRYL